MKKLVFYILIISNYCLAQKVSTNTDSLYFSGADFMNGLAVDTLIIYNSDVNDLIIDSIYSVKPYCYTLTFEYKDSLYSDRKLIGIYDMQFHLSQDEKLVMILSNPTLDPWCLGYNYEYFEDTIAIHSNDPKNKLIFSYGYDFVSGIESSDVTLLNDPVLIQNYPNPFNPTTTIRYSVPTKSFIKISVYNLLGKEIKKIVSEVKSPGLYEISFDGSRLTSGVYIYQFESGKYHESRKMILIR